MTEFSASIAGEAPTFDLAGILAAVQSTKKDDGIEVSGEINLAALAQRLPQTLRLRQDTQISEGLLDFSLKSGFSQSGERVWESTANTTRILAVTAGRKVAVKNPWNLPPPRRNTKAGIVIDRLIGKASFATLQGQGTLEAGSLTADADLDKLVVELGRFVDWTGVKLAGKLNTEVQWQRGPASTFTAFAASVQDFDSPHGPATLAGTEPAAPRRSQRPGRHDEHPANHPGRLPRPLRHRQAPCRYEKPVTNVSTTGTWPIAYTLEGDLASWLPRLQSFVPFAGWQISGGIAAEGSGEFSTSRVAIAPTKVTLSQFVAASKQYYIREPKVVLETAGTLDLEKRSFNSQATTFASSALAFRADELKAAFGSEGTSLAGHVEYPHKFDVLSSWLGAPQFPHLATRGGRRRRRGRGDGKRHHAGQLHHGD